MGSTTVIVATHPTMNDFFGLLDKWRHFPAFPLEPRSETLFALFLPMVLRDSKSVGVKVKPQVIPQFPLKHDCNNQSDKVDFFALSEDGQRGFLIELKTDMDSRRETQNNYLTRAVEKDMDEILNDLKKIVQSSTEEKEILLSTKYFVRARSHRVAGRSQRYDISEQRQRSERTYW